MRTTIAPHRLRRIGEDTPNNGGHLEWSGRPFATCYYDTGLWLTKHAQCAQLVCDLDVVSETPWIEAVHDILRKQWNALPDGELTRLRDVALPIWVEHMGIGEHGRTTNASMRQFVMDVIKDLPSSACKWDNWMSCGTCDFQESVGRFGLRQVAAMELLGLEKVLNITPTTTLQDILQAGFGNFSCEHGCPTCKKNNPGAKPPALNRRACTKNSLLPPRFFLIGVPYTPVLFEQSFVSWHYYKRDDEADNWQRIDCTYRVAGAGFDSGSHYEGAWFTHTGTGVINGGTWFNSMHSDTTRLLNNRGLNTEMRRCRRNAVEVVVLEVVTN